MGAVCGCGQEVKDIASFWNGIELRKYTFNQYFKIYEKYQMKWLTSGENNRFVDIRKCEELNKLLNNSEFTEKERIVYFDKLNDFVNNQSDKLTFFTSLAFFTKLDEESKEKNNLDNSEKYIESIRKKEVERNFDVIFELLLKMAIKKRDHEDVTRLFIQLVTEIPIPFINLTHREKDERMIIYSKENREKLFNQIKAYPIEKFYEYIFSKDNVNLIHKELSRIYFSNDSLEDLTKIRTTSNLVSTPGEPQNQISIK